MRILVYILGEIMNIQHRPISGQWWIIAFFSIVILIVLVGSTPQQKLGDSYRPGHCYNGVRDFDEVGVHSPKTARHVANTNAAMKATTSVKAVKPKILKNFSSSIVMIVSPSVPPALQVDGTEGVRLLILISDAGSAKRVSGVHS